MDELNPMNQQLNQYQQQIASYTGKLLRDYFGKGPESVFVSIGQQYITIYLRNFITPSERVLLEQDHEMIVHQMRETLIQRMIPEISSYIDIVTGVKPHHVYYDWNLHNKTMMLTVICDEPVPGSQDVAIDYTGKAAFEKEIDMISTQAQKSPEEIYSLEVGPRALIVIRNGILVRIEKEFIRLGYAEMLKGVKRNLEKSYLHNNAYIQKILDRRVVDTFVDWNLESDSSVLLLILEPNKG